MGLCIALWDILKVDDAFIFPGDGSSHSVVHFRYTVFRPFMDEILLGKIKGCSKEGVHGKCIRYFCSLSLFVSRDDSIGKYHIYLASRALVGVFFCVQYCLISVLCQIII